MLFYQDIPDNMTEIVTDLSQNNTLAELMAIAFVLGMLSLPIFATYLVAKTIRNPKRTQEENETPNEKLIDVLQTYAEQGKAINRTYQAIIQVENGLGIITKVLEGLVNNVNTGGEQHLTFLDAMQTIKAQVNEELGKVVEATNTMNSTLTPLIETLIMELAKDRIISESDKHDIAKSVLSGMPEQLRQLWETNQDAFISAISNDIVMKLSATKSPQVIAQKIQKKAPTKPETIEAEDKPNEEHNQ